MEFLLVRIADPMESEILHSSPFHLLEQHSNVQSNGSSYRRVRPRRGARFQGLFFSKQEGDRVAVEALDRVRSVRREGLDPRQEMDLGALGLRQRIQMGRPDDDPDARLPIRPMELRDRLLHVLFVICSLLGFQDPVQGARFGRGFALDID